MKKKKKREPKTLGDWAYIAIKKHLNHTTKYETDVLKDKDPEALHQMRVGMRRLRTAINGFAPALALPKSAQEQKVAKIARKLGELRDLDVLQETLQTQIALLPTEEQDILKKVLASLGKQRQKTLGKVQKTLKSSTYQKLIAAFKDWLEEPTYGELAEVSIYEVLPDLLLPSISQLFLHPAWLVGVKIEGGEMEPKNLDSEQVRQLLDTHGDSVHSLRKQAKRVRYQMELFTDFYDDAYKSYLKDIKEIQSLLGEIQDSFVLAEFLSEVDADMVKMPILTAQLTETRYQVWQKWQSLQQRYLNFEVRKDFHSSILKPVLPVEEKEQKLEQTKSN
ncbi:MAG: CHAD domain-containing protein [Coleofasciculaceae cyanobacterium]